MPPGTRELPGARPHIQRPSQVSGLDERAKAANKARQQTPACLPSACPRSSRPSNAAGEWAAVVQVEVEVGLLSIDQAPETFAGTSPVLFFVVVLEVTTPFEKIVLGLVHGPERLLFQLGAPDRWGVELVGRVHVRDLVWCMLCYLI